ncbi:hypothetical protein ACHAWC_005199 [Mediolabrus comicus]
MDMLTSTITAAKRAILSVGSGDGSQQASIVKSGHINIVSTFFESEQALIAKYGNAREHIALLRDKASAVLFEVDATELHSHPQLVKKKFDVIIFTFPHTGVSNFICGHSGPNPTSIESNKQLIRDFLKSAQHIIARNGEIHVTLKTSAPYDKWTFPDFARYEIEPKSNYGFNLHLFPGYVHQSTKGHMKVNNGMAKTYVFSTKRNRDGNEIGEAKEEVVAASTPFTLSMQFTVTNDDDIERLVLEVLSFCQDAKRDVLDIRRQLPEAIRPDTRQLNRVLYKMELLKRVKRGPSKTCNQKPTWTLQDECIVHQKRDC